MTLDSKAESFVAVTRKFVQALRYGPRELALAILGLLLLVGAVPLLPTLVEMLPFLSPALPWLRGLLAVLGLFLLGSSILRIWKRAVAPLPEGKPKPAAIKGPAPFGPQDAELFARLGRNDDLDRLRGWILDDQKPLVALMGESGVGKTSLLRAGLAHHLQDDKVPVLYWEAVPTEPEAKLLHAARMGWEDEAKAPKTFEELASAVASGRRVVVIDQAEQLSPERHPRIFELLRQVATADPPYRATWVVAFRREFLPAWRDFELSLPEAVQRRMETLSLQRFLPKAAEKVIAVLVEEGKLPVDQKLVEELVEGVAVEGKVSPADIGISLLVLSELAGGRPDGSLSLDDFRESGGQAGLLTRYLERLLEQLPEAERREVLRGLLALIDLEKDQRLAEGRTLAELEEAVKPASLPRLAAALRYLASGRARVLEELPGEPARYRLLHERLIPAIRKLTGVLLAEAERASLALERGYRVWAQDRQARYLLHRKDLQAVSRFKDQIRWGREEADKREFVRLSRRRDKWKKAGVVAAGVAAFSLVIGLAEFTQEREHRSLLDAWQLPPDLYDHLGHLEELTLPGTVTRLDWLRNAKRLKKLTVEDGVLESLRGLPAGLETLSIGDSRLPNLSRLPSSLTSLTIGASRIREIESLPSGLRLLDLDLTSEPILDLDALPRSMSSLRLVLPDKSTDLDFTKLGDLESLTLHSGDASVSRRNRFPAGLRSLSLRAIDLASFEEVPRNLRSFSYLVASLPPVGALPKGLEHLALGPGQLPPGVVVANFGELKLPALRSLELKYRLGIFPLDVVALPQSLTRLEVWLNAASSGRAAIRLPALPTRLESVVFESDWVMLREELPQTLSSLKMLGLGRVVRGNEEHWQRFLNRLDSLDFDHGSLAVSAFPSRLTALDFRNIGPGMKLPSSLTRLKTFTLPATPLPPGLRSLEIAYYQEGELPRRELPRLPDGLSELSLRGTSVRKLPANLQRLTRLDMSFTPIDDLYYLPHSLKSLSLSLGQVDTLEDLPPNVTALHFHGEVVRKPREPW